MLHCFVYNQYAIHCDPTFFIEINFVSVACLGALQINFINYYQFCFLIYNFGLVNALATVVIVSVESCKDCEATQTLRNEGKPFSSLYSFFQNLNFLP